MGEEDDKLDWLYEAMNTLNDPHDACDFDDDEAAALRKTIADAYRCLKNLEKELETK